MNYLPREKVLDMMRLFAQGYSIRNVAKMTGAAINTSQAYSWVFRCTFPEESVCYCGRPLLRHDSCVLRVARNPVKRQSLFEDSKLNLSEENKAELTAKWDSIVVKGQEFFKDSVKRVESGFDEMEIEGLWALADSVKKLEVMQREPVANRKRYYRNLAV